MPKSKFDQAREERSAMEIIVDSCNESVRFTRWFCYLEDKLKFSFRARCTAPLPVSPLKRGEEIEVIGLLDDDRQAPREIFVQIRWQRRQLGYPWRRTFDKAVKHAVDDQLSRESVWHCNERGSSTLRARVDAQVEIVVEHPRGLSMAG